MKPSRRHSLTLALAAAISFTASGATADRDETVQLSPFTVNTARDSAYRGAESTSAALIAMPLRDTPMTVQVFTAEFLKDFDVGDSTEFIRFVPGGVFQGGNNDAHRLRGFGAQSMRNSMASGGRHYVMANTERIEIVQGGNSVLFGTANPGGLVNHIPKLPKFVREHSLDATYGSNDHRRILLDTTGPVSLFGGKRIAYRLIGEYMDEGGYGDYVGQWRKFIAPSVLVKPFDGVTLRAEFEYLNDMREVNAAAEARAALNPDGSLTPLAIGQSTDPQRREVVFTWDRSRRGFGEEFRLQGPGAEDTNHQRNSSIEATWLINDTYTLRLYGGDNNRNFKVRPSYTVDGALTGVAQVQNLTNTFVDVWGYKADLVGRYNFWNRVKVDAILGHEFNSNWFANNNFRRPTNIVIPNPRTVPLDREAIRWRDEDTRFLNFTGGTTSRFRNTRLFNSVRAFDERLVMMVGISYVKITSVPATKTDIRSQSDEPLQLGALFKVTPDISIYAIKSESLNGNFSANPLANGSRALPPLAGELEEAGFRVQRGAFSLSAGAFEITARNLIRNITVPIDPANPNAGNMQIAVISGEEKSEGVDYSLAWQPTRELSLTANGAHADARVTRDLDPSRVGLSLPAAPRNAYGLTARYVFSEGQLRGLMTALTMNYQDGSVVGNSADRRFMITDDVTYINVAASYRLAHLRGTPTVKLTANNLLGKHYIDAGNFHPGLVARVSVGLRF